jgi:hypothetical protein
MFNTLRQTQTASLRRSPDASPGVSRPARRRKNTRQHITDPLAHGASSNRTSLPYPRQAHGTSPAPIRHYPGPPFPVPRPDAPPEISPSAGQHNPPQITSKSPAQAALSIQSCSPSLPYPWPDAPPSTINIQPTVRSDSLYSPYRILLSSNNIQEYFVSLHGQADGSVSMTHARHQLSLITINF